MRPFSSSVSGPFSPEETGVCWTSWCGPTGRTGSARFALNGLFYLFIYISIWPPRADSLVPRLVTPRPSLAAVLSLLLAPSGECHIADAKLFHPGISL